MARRQEMKSITANPLAVFAIAFCTAFFGISWALLVGHWLGFSSFSYEQYIIGELLPLAYAGAGLSIGFMTVIIAVKINRPSR